MTQWAAITACHAGAGRPSRGFTENDNEGRWELWHEQASLPQPSPPQQIRAGYGAFVLQHLSPAETYSRVEKTRHREQVTWPRPPKSGRPRPPSPQ